MRGNLELRRTSHIPILEVLDTVNQTLELSEISRLAQLNHEYCRNEIIYLADNGFIERVKRGHYRITERGRAALEHRELNGRPEFCDVLETADAA